MGQHLAADAVAICVDCHVTSIRAARDRSVPEAADRGIGCERCHGPGGNHVAAVAADFDDLAIARPGLASAGQITRLCAACHNSDDPSITDNDPLTIRFQTLTLPRSRCYTESDGKLSCLTCHDPHRDAETTAAHYEAKCLSCHTAVPGTVPVGAGKIASDRGAIGDNGKTSRDTLPAISDRGAIGDNGKTLRHTLLETSDRGAIGDNSSLRTTCPVNPRNKCLSCHMPAMPSPIHHAAFTDHHIRVHRPAETVQ